MLLIAMITLASQENLRKTTAVLRTALDGVGARCDALEFATKRIETHKHEVHDVVIRAPTPPPRAHTPQHVEEDEDAEGKAMLARLPPEVRKVLSVLAVQLHSKKLHPEELIRQMDLDGDGAISDKEMADGMKKCGVILSAKDIRTIMTEFDHDASGTVECSELTTALQTYIRSVFSTAMVLCCGCYVNICSPNLCIPQCGHLLRLLTTALCWHLPKH